MSNFDLNKIHTDIISKLSCEREQLLQELNEKQTNFQNTSKSCRDLMAEKIKVLNEIQEKKFTSNKLKKELEIKRKFLEGVHKIQIPIIDKEIERDFTDITNSLHSIQEISKKLNHACLLFEKDQARFSIQHLSL
jgi:predicted nuclease with TOPRIM domain